jgi:probable F420-dependent oxidoreductase
MRAFRFAVHTGGDVPPDDWPSFARRVESLGYTALYVTDHLTRQLAPMPALAAAAAATERLRIGTYVLANDFRHPLLVAREAATLDRLSGGRLELGIGGGWMRSDYRQLGLPYDRPGIRIARLQESVGLLVRLLSGESVDHRGRFYTLAGAEVGPLPVQRPHPPLVIGGGGPRLLRLAAEHAGIISLAPRMTPGGRPTVRGLSEDAAARAAHLVRQLAGGRADAIDIDVFVADVGVVGRGQPITASAIARMKSAAPPLVGGSPHLLYGTLEQLREQMLSRRERSGINAYGIPMRAMEAMAPLVAELTGR